MTPFEVALQHTLHIEKGYADHPSDRGGKTNWGVTESLARQYGYKGEMLYYPKESAIRVYKEHFWDFLHCDWYWAWNQAIALELFDSGVNAGRIRAAKWFQRALNVANRREKIAPDLKVDGLPWRTTLEAARRFVKDDELRVILTVMNCLQGAHYIDMAENDETQEDFIHGWFLKRVAL